MQGCSFEVRLSFHIVMFLVDILLNLLTPINQDIMALDFTKYEPINSKEKVDSLIEDLISDGVNLQLIKTEILIHIRKSKIQLYFLESIENVKTMKRVNHLISLYQSKQSVSIKRKTDIKKAKSIPKHVLNVEYEDKSFVQFFLNMNIAEIADFISIPKIAVLTAFKRNLNIEDLKLDYKPSSQDLTECAQFLIKSYDLFLRKVKRQRLLKNDIENFSSRRMIYLNESQKSYGKEGNYSKLIYIRTKT